MVLRLFDILQPSSHCLSIINNTTYVFGGALRPRDSGDNNIYAIKLDIATISTQNGMDTLSASNAPTSRVSAASTALGDVVSLWRVSSQTFTVSIPTPRESWSAVAPRGRTLQQSLFPRTILIRL